MEDGVVFFLDKVEETIRACDNLLLTWRTHGSPLGDRTVKETMYRMSSKTIDELEQWRDNSSTDDTLTSLTSIETSLEEIKEMDSAILREEEEAATEFHFILKLLIKKIKTAGNNPQIRQWWFDVMTSRPPPLPKNEEKYGKEILDRVKEGSQEEEWAITMPQVIYEILQKNHIKKPNRDSHITRYRRKTMDTNGRVRQGPHKQMPRCTRIDKQKTKTAGRDQRQIHQQRTT